MAKIEDLIKERVLIIDGAMGTQIQSIKIPDEVWEGRVGCNELLNETYPEVIYKIHKAYAKAGADIIKTNTFGALPWVLEDYQIANKTYQLAKEGAKLVKRVCEEFSTEEKPRFVAGSLGPGTKLPSLGHIEFDEMSNGYREAVKGLIDGGVDIFLLETCQDPLQIKSAILACQDICREKRVDIPIMISVTIELSGTMLIGTDTLTIATILEPFDILSLGFNCGTGPVQVKKHIKRLSEVWKKPISIHSNAGLPQNRGGYTFYPMGPDEFSTLQKEFLEFDGVSFLGGCCGTTPQHIAHLNRAVKGIKPKKPTGSYPKSLASLFETKELIQNPPPFYIGERSNATGSKAFRELLLKEDYDKTLSVAQEQVRNGAFGIDLSVGFAGRDENRDMKILSLLYSQKITLPLMIDSTKTEAIEIALKNVGGKPIINSVNLEDGEEKFDKICSLAKRYGTSLVCLTIDEKGMAKTKEQKIAIAKRIYQRATTLHKLDPEDLVFDLLTFTVGSGDEEYYTSAIETIEAIKEFHKLYPKVGFVLGVSNISFGLSKHSREYLNSVFLYHCIQAGLTMAIVNVKNIMPIHKISNEDRKICEDLLFNNRENGDPLFKFISHFEEVGERREEKSDEELEKLSTKEQIHKFLIDGDKERMMPLIEKAKEEIEPQIIVNEILINAMKEVGELFGSGKMQLPFVLQSAEVMKAVVDYLNPYLPKKEKESDTTLILGTVKGDVHDVGKNLVDIILTNNGFRVINIGIKVDIEDFIKAYREYKADAIGMSGLLVKSTAVMQENLEELKKRGIDVPILLGGAALTKKFVNQFCRPNYDGAIFYCKDAFDGVVAMGKIEKGELDIEIEEEIEENREKKIEKEIIIPPLNEISMPKRDIAPLIPPFWGRRVFNYNNIKELAFEWINHKDLFANRWGYTKRGKRKEEYQKILDNEVLPLYEKLREEILLKDLFQPVLLYGYYPCRADDNTLLIFDESEGYFNENDINREPLDEVIARTKYQITFPRQKRKPFRALSDYFQTERDDIVAFTTVSSGLKIANYLEKLYKEGKYKEYHLMSALSGELAEALAEIIHKQIRIELNITEGKEKAELKDIQMKRYRGKRYSFGYPSCPDMQGNEIIFKLLKPEEFGVTLTESFALSPEHSTCAIVVHHPEALYYAL